MIPGCPGKAPAPQGSAAFLIHTQPGPWAHMVPASLGDHEMGVSSYLGGLDPLNWGKETPVWPQAGGFLSGLP